MVSGTGLHLGSGGKWNWVQVCKIIRAPLGDHLLDGFVGLQRADDRLINIKIKFQNLKSYYRVRKEIT